MQIDIVKIIWNKPPWFRLTLQLFSSIEIHPLKMTFRYLLIKLFEISGFPTSKVIPTTPVEVKKPSPASPLVNMYIYIM